MASWMVHLRIADELLDRLDHADETAFVMGNMAPDSGVPSADWKEYHPPKSVSHFKTRPDDETFFDTDAFRRMYFSDEAIKQYSLREFSFFLGYYVHLLTDVLWTGTVYLDLLKSHPKACAEDKHKLVWSAKADWYDLDFLYIERNPGFRAFSIYENAVNFDNEFMDLFSKDAFENRRRYICGFYRSGQHGDLHREYRYLSPAQADAFVETASRRIAAQESRFFRQEDPPGR